VEDGRISWTGGDAPREQAIDLRGRTVVPGFIDSHMHPTLVAETLDAVACTPPAVTTIDGMVNALRQSAHAGRGDEVWIRGWGYDESMLEEHRTPTRQDLDRVSTTQPVFVLRSDCHSAVCNGVALRRAGVSRDTPDPAGGSFGRDDDGEPNGVLIEFGANEFVRRAMRRMEHADRVRRLARLSQHYSERGIVAVSDMMAQPFPDDVDAYRDAVQQGLRQQVLVYHGWTYLAGRTAEHRYDTAQDQRVRLAGLKVFMDGSISNRTAWVSEPFRASTLHGTPTLSDEALLAALQYARSIGVQLAVHVMGDAAISHALDLLADEEPWLEAMPSVRLEHATLLTDHHMRRIRRARMRFAVVTQVIFLFAEHASYLQNLSPDRLRLAYAMRTQYQRVASLALSSDAPGTSWNDPDNVFVSLKAAVARVAHNGQDIGQEEAITVPQAVLLYTGRARHVAPFRGVGTIEPGAEASFAVLDQDIFTLDPTALDTVRVDETYIAGELVHQRS
jgi:predicted amidohydrolase YtcJ